MNWRNSGVKALALGSLAASALFAAPSAAEAHSRGFFGLSLGFPVYAPLYAPPAYYYPPPVYAPPPLYAPSPAYRQPAPGSQSGSNCQPYESTTTINGRPETVIGTACRQPDGTWRIVR
jgi:hypothetical protein